MFKKMIEKINRWLETIMLDFLSDQVLKMNGNLRKGGRVV